MIWRRGVPQGIVCPALLLQVDGSIGVEVALKRM